MQQNSQEQATISQEQADMILKGIAIVEEQMDRIIYEELLEKMRQLIRAGFMDSVFALLEKNQPDLPITDAFLMTLVYEFKGGRLAAVPYYHRLKKNLPQYTEYWQVLYLMCMHAQFEEEYASKAKSSGSEDPESSGTKDC